MAGQTIINFDGLSADAADKLGKGLVEAAKAKIEAIVKASEKMSPDDTLKVERLLGGVLRADGNCGNGCA
ncbi:hypothetical protein ACQR0Z_22960 [Bradyrhizobium sp. HKCCYLS3077]|uniref:hypothetical protein n=1 Tax=Bradyrhizobium sp. HKCCYLS3077 TaxID=3420761 RepID=UPI003EB88B95